MGYSRIYLEDDKIKFRDSENTTPLTLSEIAEGIANIIEAKGDLIVGTGAGTADNLIVGTNNDVLVADSSQILGVKWTSTFSGIKSFSNGGIVNVPQTYTPDAAGTATLDLSKGNRHNIQMPAGNITIAISNATTHQIFEVAITQDSTGSRTVTWFNGISWTDGTAPTLTTTANKRDVFIFIVTGANTYDGFIAGMNI